MTKVLNEHKVQSNPANPKSRQLRDNPDWLKPKPKPKPKQFETGSSSNKGSKPDVDNESESDDEFSYGKDDEVRPKTGKTIKPVIGRGFEGDSIAFDIGKLEKTRRPMKGRTAKEAKKKAIEMVRKKGAIKTDDPNAVGRKTKTNKRVDEIKKRVNSVTIANDSQDDSQESGQS